MSPLCPAVDDAALADWDPDWDIKGLVDDHEVLD